MALSAQMSDFLAQSVAILRAGGEAASTFATLDRIFSLRVSESFIDGIASVLILAMQRAAPMVRLQLTSKAVKHVTPFHQNAADLEIGGLGDFVPEVRTRPPFRGSVHRDRAPTTRY